MSRILKFAAIILLFSGCAATGPAFQSIDVNQTDKAIVYVYRPSRFFYGGGWPNIYLNGQKQFALKNNGYGVLFLEAGDYEIKAEGSFFLTNWQPGPASINLSVHQGLEYFVRVTPEHESTIFGFKTVAVTGTAQIIEVSKEQALSEIHKTKKIN